MNKALEVKYDGEFLLEEKGTDLLQLKEFINERYIFFAAKRIHR